MLHTIHILAFKVLHFFWFYLYFYVLMGDNMREAEVLALLTNTNFKLKEYNFPILYDAGTKSNPAERRFLPLEDRALSCISRKFATRASFAFPRRPRIINEHPAKKAIITKTKRKN